MEPDKVEHGWLVVFAKFNEAKIPELLLVFVWIPSLVLATVGGSPIIA